MTARVLFLISFGIILCSGQQSNILNERIRTVFRGGFDNIVTPEPSIESTLAPTYLQNNGQTCKCVPYWSCANPPNADVTENRFYGEIDVRYTPESCQDVLDVCCPVGSETKVPVKPHEQHMTPPPLDNHNINPPPSARAKCGQRNVNGIDFTIVGNTNNEAGFAEFPWMVALLVSDSDCLCGGSLIHPRIVLTGAHCVFNVSSQALRVRAGEWDTQTTKERLPHQERTINSIITHPDFNTKTLANDLVSFNSFNGKSRVVFHPHTVILYLNRHSSSWISHST